MRIKQLFLYLCCITILWYPAASWAADPAYPRDANNVPAAVQYWKASDGTYKSGPTSEVIYNLTLTNANTEYSLALPSVCYGYSIQARTSTSLKVAFTSGESGTTYFTIKAGDSWDSGFVILLNTTLYIQSPTAGTVVEIVAKK